MHKNGQDPEYMTPDERHARTTSHQWGSQRFCDRPHELPMKMPYLFA